MEDLEFWEPTSEVRHAMHSDSTGVPTSVFAPTRLRFLHMAYRTHTVKTLQQVTHHGHVNISPMHHLILYLISEFIYLFYPILEWKFSMVAKNRTSQPQLSPPSDLVNKVIVLVYIL